MDDKNMTKHGWQTFAATPFKVFAQVTDLLMHTDTGYHVLLRAVNHGGLVSPPVTANFFVENNKPAYSGFFLVYVNQKIRTSLLLLLTGSETTLPLLESIKLFLSFINEHNGLLIIIP